LDVPELEDGFQHLSHAFVVVVFLIHLPHKQRRDGVLQFVLNERVLFQHSTGLIGKDVLVVAEGGLGFAF
jgi:hypothetical protein